MTEARTHCSRTTAAMSAAPAATRKRIGFCATVVGLSEPLPGLTRLATGTPRSGRYKGNSAVQSANARHEPCCRRPPAEIHSANKWVISFEYRPLVPKLPSAADLRSDRKE